jgi:branched-chain amino acid transport system permease protein
VLLAAFMGGVGFFFGPILGAVVFTFFAVALSEFARTGSFLSRRVLFRVS